MDSREIINEEKNEVKKANVGFNEKIMNMVANVAKTSGQELTQVDQGYAMDIVATTYKRLMETGTSPNDVNFVGCNFPGQVKKYARLGLSLNESEIYLDLRNNSKTGKKDINLKMQYQGEERLLIKYCQLHGGIDRIIKDVVMDGEELIYARDMATGVIKVTDHKIPNIFKRNISFATKDKMLGAYAIAYHKDGEQTFIYIDMNRIDRAIKASASNEKTIYKNDFMKMVLKTASHELYKDLKRYNVVPDDLQRDLIEAQLDTDEVENEINSNANSEAIDVEVTEKQAMKEIPEDSGYESTMGVNFKVDTGEVIQEPVHVNVEEAPF